MHFDLPAPKHFKAIWFASLLCTLVCLLLNISKLFGLQVFDFGNTWRRLFQKLVMRTKFDIYVFIPPEIDDHIIFWIEQ
jgi:hypothetical protein